ncbi:hypothetical protein BQ8482_430031 [Mesorhizobium delmotii]|uniref:Uncharacterized protein n=1 Tax=Mesorhizobium delmotii TaxID=1631247 RepID=A0A2P9ATK1_9HYPH|nr:hypothetical protein BQ8482_430031 [Mesorhizobium delmotii]
MRRQKARRPAALGLRLRQLATADGRYGGGILSFVSSIGNEKVVDPDGTARVSRHGRTPVRVDLGLGFAAPGLIAADAEPDDHSDPRLYNRPTELR